MPITVTIAAETAHEARAEMRALLGQDFETPAPAVEAPEKPKATRSTKAKAEPAKTDTGEAGASSESVDTAPALETTSAGTTAPTDASPSEDAKPTVEITATSLKERGMKYAAKAGPQAVVEMHKAAGAENGKFSEIEGNGERMNKLSALLEDAGY